MSATLPSAPSSARDAGTVLRAREGCAADAAPRRVGNVPVRGRHSSARSAAAGGRREAASRRGRGRLPRLRQDRGRPDLGGRALAADRDRPDRTAAGLDPRAEGALRHRDASGRARGGDGAADAADRARHANGRRHRPGSHRPVGRRQRAPALVVHGATGPDAAAERQLRGDLGRHPPARARGHLAGERSRSSGASSPASALASRHRRDSRRAGAVAASRTDPSRRGPPHTPSGS